MLDPKVFERPEPWRGSPRGALAVLSLNPLFLVIGAAGTLLLQRRRRLR